MQSACTRRCTRPGRSGTSMSSAGGWSTRTFEAGIVNAEWPARMQRLASGALVDQAPQGCEIWLDGGHNAEGGRVAAAALGDLEERVSRPLVVILGMRVEAASSVEAAVRSLARLAYEVPPRILITGSLYLAGHVLSANGTPPG